MPASGVNSNPTASELPLANTHTNRMVSKQLLQADAVELFRLIRPAGINEVLMVLMPARLYARVCYSPEVGVNKAWIERNVARRSVITIGVNLI